MKKNIYVLIIFICVGFSSVFSQTAEKKEFAFGYKDFPKEKIFVHFNSSFLVSGENLFYKIYCLNTTNGNLSTLSKIAYVELLDSDKKTVFKHKILLKSGLGKGDFFIKTSIPSGNYKLVAYTQWMRNDGESIFFQNDITIINPFRANKKLTVKIPEYQDSIKSKNDAVKEDNIKILVNPLKSEFIEVKTNKKTFLKREKVVLTIKGLQKESSYGNYSLSVRKLDSINVPHKSKTISYTNKLHKNTSSKDSIFFLPELRGELLSGRVFIKETDAPISNTKVSLSIPGENAIFKMATTNKSGVFYFNLDKEYENSKAIIQVVDLKKGGYVIRLHKDKLPNYNGFVFNDFKLTPELNDLILKKSILNQVENAYHSVKNDSILPTNIVAPSYEYNVKKYFLNDYSRFKSLRETVTEVVDAVYISQNKGEYTFHVKSYNDIVNSDVLPLVLIDGALIQNHHTISDYDANNIESIGVVRDKYIYGGQLFNGIISIKTVRGNYIHPLSENYIKNVQLIKSQVNKKYFKQVYNDSKLNRIPDFRNQLLWQPNFALNGHETLISFYTSNNVGAYEICIEGYTNEGKPVSLREIISVKK